MMWSVEVTQAEGNGVITVTHGYVDGKRVVNHRTVSAGKNLGKKNATTPYTQAVSEAQSLWQKKQDGGYAPQAPATAITNAIETATAGATTAPAAEGSDEEVGTTDHSVPRPMLAHDYNKRGKHIKFPCFAQRKLDGVRCVAVAGKGLYSRNGKVLSPHMSHIRATIDTLPAGTVLDGELYSDTLNFQQIVGLVKKKTLRGTDATLVAQIHLCVYDTIRDGTYAERNAWLTDLFAREGAPLAHLRLLPTARCETMESVKELHAAYVAEGYEGLILRNFTGKYATDERSNDLQKYKEFHDAEYPVIGFKEGDGVEKGCVLWVCKTPSGTEFSVRPRGTHEDRKAALSTAAAQIGKPLTVRYQELTVDGVPRFPVGIIFRTYE